MARFDLFDPEQAPRGVSTLIKTPLLEGGRVDFDSYARQVEHVVDVGTCLAVPGMRGCETWTLSETERVRCLEITLEICKDRTPVCATVAGLSISDLIAAARRAEDMGADMIAIVVPPWIRHVEDILTCVKATAESVSLPNLVHSVGGAGDMVVPTERLARLPKESPNIRYMKEEAPLDAVRRVSQLLKTPGGEDYLNIMVGSPLVLGYLAGARMFMSSADVIEPFMAVIDAMEAGDVDEARRIDRDVDVLQFVRGYIKGQYNNKVIMERRGIFASARLASPRSELGLTDLTPAEEDELTEALRPLMPYYEKFPPSPPAQVKNSSEKKGIGQWRN